MTGSDFHINFVEKDQQELEFRAKGFVIARNVLSERVVVAIRDDLMALLEDAPERFAGRDINYAIDGQVNSLHNLDTFGWSRLLLGHREVRQFASQLLSSEVEEFGSELFAKPSGTGIPVPDHQDDHYWCISDGQALTMWFALSRSDEVSGAVYYYPGSHRLGPIDHVPSGVPGSSQMIPNWQSRFEDDQELAPLDPGDCVIHHARTVHGSGPNHSDHHRLGLTVRFKSANSSVDSIRKAKYLAELKTQLEARGQE